MRRPNTTARLTATAWRWPPERVSTRWRTEPRPMFNESSCSRGSALHGPPVDDREQAAEAAADPRLSTEEQVLGDVHHGHHRQLLVDGLDAMGPGRDRAAQVDPPTVDEDFADIRLEHAREDLDQRRLPGTVVADQPQYLPRKQVQVDLTQRLEVTKRLRDASCLEDR